MMNERYCGLDIILYRTPSDIVDLHRPAIDRWLARGHGHIYQFDLVCDDAFALQVVKDLCVLGYAANGKRATFACMCDEHGGTEIPLDYFEIRVMRHVR